MLVRGKEGEEIRQYLLRLLVLSGEKAENKKNSIILNIQEIANVMSFFTFTSVSNSVACETVEGFIFQFPAIKTLLWSLQDTLSYSNK